MDTRLSSFSTKPSTYRAYLKQQGQQLLDSIKQQQPALPDAQPLIPQQPAPSAQMTPQASQNDQGGSLAAQLGGLLGKAGTLPQDALNAVRNLGSQAFNEFCQKFVEQATLGHSGVFPSAIAAWQAQQDKAKQGFDGIAPGDVVYFAPDASNNNYGHTGIYTGNGNFVSATDNGVKELPLSQWMQSTGQHYLGYVPQNQLSDPASKGNAGKGGGNPFVGMINGIKQGVGNFVHGYTAPQTEAIDPNNLAAQLGAFAANSPAGEIGSLAGQAGHALSGVLQNAPALSHGLAALPMVAGMTDAYGNKVAMPVKTGLQDISENMPAVVDTLKRYDTQLGDMAPAAGTSQIDMQLYPDLVKHWQMIYGANGRPPATMGQMAAEVRDGLRAALRAK